MSFNPRIKTNFLKNSKPLQCQLLVTCDTKNTAIKQLAHIIIIYTNSM